ncbi:MAG TPA: aldehyde dehydrogenase family protein [Methylocella sp.]|nr:aldehyde dehydrogenase family protein [Methylocella sp.]
MSLTLVSTNPSRNYEILGEVAVSTPGEVSAAVAKARAARPGWQALGVRGRVAILEKLVHVFKKGKDAFALMTCREMGRPIGGAEATMDLGLSYWDWYLAHGEDCLKPYETYRDEKEIAEVFYEPAGVAAVIVPWNFPFSNFTWGVGQNLVAGNTVVFKISEEVPLFGKLLDAAFVEAGVPEGVFNQLYGAGDVGAALLEQDVDLMCFTGSTATGRRVYQAATDKMIPALLEMGGSDPGIVFADADVPRIIEKIYEARFRNSGQICNALKRLIVHESRSEEVVSALATILKSKRVGDPEDRTTDIGPLCAKRQLELLESQVEDARAKGATIVAGGRKPDGLKGAFYEPTILIDVTRDMRTWREEVFGPVLPIVTFKTTDEALSLAKDTPYGLGGYIFTEDKELAVKIARELRVGMVQINKSTANRACNPFGGRGISGLGMENGIFGFHDVSRRKLIVRER